MSIVDVFYAPKAKVVLGSDLRNTFILMIIYHDTTRHTYAREWSRTLAGNARYLAIYSYLCTKYEHETYCAH